MRGMLNRILFSATGYVLHCRLYIWQKKRKSTMRHKTGFFDRLNSSQQKRRQQAVFDMLFGIDTKAKSSDECRWRTIAGHRVCFRKDGRAEGLPSFLEAAPGAPAAPNAEKPSAEKPTDGNAFAGKPKAEKNEQDQESVRRRLVDVFRDSEWDEASPEELQKQRGMMEEEIASLRESAPKAGRDERVKELEEAIGYVQELERVAGERVSAREGMAKREKQLLSVLPDGWIHDTDSLFDSDGNKYILSDDPEENVAIIEEALRNLDFDPEHVLRIGELRKVGASFLDDVEPDESGSLIQEGTERSYVRVADQEIEDWDEVPYQIQESVEESIAESIADGVANDSDFYSMLEEEARDRFDEEWDEESFLEEMIQSNEADGMSREEAETFTRTAYENGEQWIVDAKEKQVAAFVDQEVLGTWGDRRRVEEIESRIDDIDNDYRLEYASQIGYLDDLSQSVESVMDDIGIDADDIATMFGVGSDFEFVVSEDKDNNGLQISWNESGDYSDGVLDRRIYRDYDGEIVVKHEYFTAPKDAEPGFGLQVFSRSVAAYRKHGFAKIKTHAAGSAEYMRTRAGSFNGYYTWPMFGFDQDIEDLSSVSVQDAVRRDWPDAVSVLDIIQSKGGPEWWRENGGGTKDMVFDLSTGSRSMRQLEAYVQKRKDRREKAKKALEEYEGAEQ